ncbi:hypothetical protein [Maridesulfovibrio salexigens]|uniref:Uncharacterized protein n=1 Tax=Maridesulfovibrio salexigens (strain ATCC 14822 / DSM 2638 / NCIMB 8403 / VKM B-1763) TaxID=526222 RepID=C6BW00_MARSD|nr:hypothetical protein [Maridesulfovibrio salexigens]ACS80203.1 conserved hypothetical protein [Maridesulfovibrio salexigens DSM 2638]
MVDKFYKSINQAWEQFGKVRWQISRRTFFNYVGKGKQVPPLNGKYYEDDICEVAEQLGWVPIGQVAEADQPDDEGLTGDSAKRFQEAKAKDKEFEAELKRLKLNKELGKLIDRENVEMIMAGKTAVLDTGLRQLFIMKARDFIFAVDGKVEREDAFIQMVNDELDALFSEFARTDEITVEFSSGS